MDERLATLRRQRGTCKSRITHLETFITNYRTSGEPLETLQTKIEFVRSTWVQFEDIQTKIEELDEEDTEREAIEDRYCQVVGRSRALVNSIQHPPVGNPNGDNAGNGAVDGALKVRLPTMNLPVFDGNPEKWLEFLVLKGRAADVIQSLETSAENYPIAWNLLTKRFEDKRAITARHLQALLEIPSMQKESGTQLRQTLDGFLRHVRALEILKANTWDTVINHLMIAKFDSATRREWRSHIKNMEVITVASLTEFLEERCSIIEPETTKSSAVKSNSNNRIENKSTPQQKRVDSSNAFVNTSSDNRNRRSCAFCGEESHFMYTCHKFKELTVPQRLNAVNERRLCRNCLRPKHFADNCQSSGCKRCNAKHNTLLHPIEKSENARNSTMTSATENNSRSVNSEQQVTSVNCNSVQVPVPSKVLLSTARVFIYDTAERSHECRVLLDSGSQSNFLTKEFCDRLKLATQPFNCSVGGIAASINITEITSALIQSRHTAYRAKVKFLITKKIIDELPLSQIEIGHLQIPTNLKLADETFHVPGKIDMILGAGVFWGLLCIGQIKLGRSQPVLQKTHLAETRLRDQVEKFWTIEEIDQKIAPSKNDAACEEHFAQTHRRDEQGRFTVSLPLRGHTSELGESRNSALHRLFRLERKLEKEPEISEEYQKFMNEYIVLKHMTAVDSDHDGSLMAHYIPHHAVITNPNDRFKLRVVFDASAKTSTGKSLNDILHVGPTIQETLFSIVLRFRQHQYVVTADIVKMYRQVKVQEEQRDLQRILWRSSGDMPVQEYQLNTVTYGLASAPFLAIRALHQAAHNACDSHPYASRVIIRDFYVDDLLTGHDNLDDLRKLKTDIAMVLRSSGFELAKWKSNEPTLFDQNTDEFARLVNIGEEVKTLGLSWAPIKDTLQYQVIANATGNRATKRSVLSVVAQIFDPLGLVGPSTIRAKILMQRLWQLNLRWDESLPIELHTEWMTYVNQLHAINDITIPRVVICRDPTVIEIHGFSDASESAYGACVYIRSVNPRGKPMIRLLCAKSKVAPLKTICIPRLELCGAVLLAKLVNAATQTLTIPLNDRYYWCDSTIVLAWIHGEPHLRKTFVANRVTEIQQLTSHEQWRHVRSEHNPADVISRGISPNQLNDLQLWWQGPEWLQHPEEHIHQPIPLPVDEIPETKIQTIVATQVIETHDILERFSSLTKLKRVVAYCLRWKDVSKPRNLQRTHSLTVDELERATTTIVKMVQAARFAQEISDLRSKQRVNHDSVLITLHPFLDDDNIIRVGGRLRNAPVSYSRRYPVVLPSNHHVTTIIIRDAHYRALHAGAHALFASLQESFWILSAKSTIRKVLHKCIVCFRSRPVSARHFMGDLPVSRLDNTRAFLNVGIDYGGPFNLKLSRNKTCKAYISLFVCMSTKAIHLELVSDLSSAAFLNALKRFIARRGKCANIYSDNGSNFQGASRELRELYDFITQQSHNQTIDQFCSDQAIQWHFIPPYSPHMGGLWEAGIKSVKTHLRRVLSEACLTFEEMYTVLVQTEAVLNSRPLTPISSDPTDLEALTPGHFLIGGSLTAIPERNFNETPSNRLTRFQYLAKLTQQFWTRWSNEYLSNLQQRYKWNREARVSDLKVGTMVLLRDDQTPSMQWALGRILECHPGKDSQTRVISIRTAKGTVKRTVAKICILPIEI
ncbi:uncharacterized protein LOC124413362 [Diprion similis]|uniref:uncharacterized protein LOC124413362 n=1 Tax=Diprion similis TaxID=362088 RepID=UPI001EF7D51B|nr:uncharacterized protein LOC124413362 [Diprion similis]